MCGISGLWSKFDNKEDHKIQIKKMAEAINHRGPDNKGFWNDENYNLYSF